MAIIKTSEESLNTLVPKTQFNPTEILGSEVQRAYETEKENLEYRQNLWDNDPLELVGQKIKGMGYAFSDNNLILSAADYFENFSGAGYDVDPEFKKQYSKESIINIGFEMGLGTESVNRLMEAKNKSHFQGMVNRYSEMNEEKLFQQKVNSTGELIGAGLLGSVVDVTPIIAGWAYKSAKTLGTAKAAAITTATDITLDSAFAYIKDDYTMSDVALNSIISLGVNTTFARMGTKEMESLAEARASKQRTAEEKLAKEQENNQAFINDLEAYYKEQAIMDGVRKRKQKEIDNINKSNELTQQEKDVKLKEIEDREVRLTQEAQTKKQQELDNINKSNLLTKEEADAKVKEIEDTELRLTQEAQAKKQQEVDNINKSKKLTEEEKAKKLKEADEKEAKILDNARANKQKELDNINRSKQLTKEEIDTKVKEIENTEARLTEEARVKKQKEIDNINKSKKLTEEERAKKLKEADEREAKVLDNAKANKQKELENIKKSNELVEKERLAKLKKVEDEKLRGIVNKRLEFFKRQNKISKRAQKEDASKKELEKHEWFEKKRQEQVALLDIVSKNIDDAFKATLEDIKAAYGAMNKSSNYQIKQMQKDIDEMVDAISRIDNTKGQKLKNEIDKQTGISRNKPILRGKIGKDGLVTLVTQTGKNIGKVPLALAVTAGVASADDGSESDISVYDGVTALAIIAGTVIGGRSLINRFGNNGKILKQNADRIASILKDGYIAVKNKGFKNEVDRGLEQAKADFFTAIGKLISKNTPEKFIGLVYNWRNGVKDSAENIAKSLRETTLSFYAKQEHENFIGWLEATNQKTKNPLKRTELLKEFRYKIADIVEGKATPANKFEEALAKESSSVFKRMLDLALESGVESFGKIKKIENYLPKMWRNDRIQKMWRNTDDEGRAKILDAFTKSIYAKQAKKDWEKAKDVAEFRIAGINNNTYAKGSSGDREFEDLVTMLRSKYGQVDEAELAKIFTKKNDIVGRFKERIEMDMSFFENLVIKENGIDINYKLSDFVERDMFVIIDNYSREMGGHIGLAKHGFKTEAQFAREVLVEAPEEVRNDLMQMKDLILGRPVGDTSKSLGNTIINTVRSIAVALSMPLMALSTTPEVLTAISKTMVRTGGVGRVGNEVKALFNSYRKGDYMVEQIAKLTGLGSNYITHNLTIRDAQELSNMLDGGGLIEGTAAKTRDLFIKSFGMGKIQDFNEKLMMINNTGDLAKIINGKLNISDKRMLQYGITDKTKELLQDSMKLSDRGNLLDFDVSKMSAEAQDELSKVVRNMTIRNVNRSTIGGTPLFFVNEPIGRMFGTLGGFAITSYSNMGLRSIYNRDLETAVSSALWFAGAYMGVYAREMVTGNENTDEQRILKSFLNMPLSGITVLGTMTNSPSFQLLEHAAFLNDLYSADIGDDTKE